MNENKSGKKETFKDFTFLENRFEFKYILDYKKAIEIERYLRTVGLRHDFYSKGKPYIVNSLYFDTPILSDYRDKDGSYLHRKKMRARIYDPMWSLHRNSPKNVWLEIKRKRNMNVTKSRVKVDWSILMNFIDGVDLENDCVVFDTKKEREAFNEFVYLYKHNLYRPHVIIKYNRIAYMSDFFGPIRITFDSNISACMLNGKNDEKMMMSVSGNSVIMEVKYTGKLPWWFDFMLKKFNIRRNDFSKYRNSVAILRGHKLIPINR
jgi:hypothetical protein